MRPAYSDDERIVTKPVTGSGRKVEELVTATVVNKEDAALEESEYKVVVELTGSEIGQQRTWGLDLVILVEVSDRMKGTKMTMLKNALKFLIKKLSPVDDRLSVITLDATLTMLCPLQSMTDTARSDLEQRVNQLDARGQTNIVGGLQMALQILVRRTSLEDRRLKAGRTSAIMLLSDGIQSPGYGDPTGIPLYDVPVHTFDVGESGFYGAQVLKEIARRSKNGTFSSVVDLDGSGPASLIIAVSTCLAGLLTELAQDLELTISSELKINKVFTGTYQQRTDDDRSITILLGNLYASEKRTVLVSLQLPVADCPTRLDVLTVTYSFRPVACCRISGEDQSYYKSPCVSASVSRVVSPVSPECEDVIVEDARQRTLAKIAEAVHGSSPRPRYDDAKIKLEEADTLLDSVDDENDGNVIISGLKNEVRELRKLMRNKDSFERTGYAVGLASVLSHNLQRFALRGEADMKTLAYATPFVTVFANQARKFDKDCSIHVPTIEQDLEKLPPKINKKLVRNAVVHALQPNQLVHRKNQAAVLTEKVISAKDRGNENTVISAKVVSTKGGNGNPEKADFVKDHDNGKPDTTSGKAVSAKDCGNENPIISDKAVSAKDCGNENPIISDKAVSAKDLNNENTVISDKVVSAKDCGNENPIVSDKAVSAKDRSIEKPDKVFSAKGGNEKPSILDKDAFPKSGNENPKVSGKNVSPKNENEKPDNTDKVVRGKGGYEGSNEHENPLIEKVIERFKEVSPYFDSLTNHIGSFTKFLKAIIAMATTVHAVYLAMKHFLGVKEVDQ